MKSLEVMWMIVKIEAMITMSGEVQAETLLLAIAPENQTMPPEGSISTKIVDNKVITLLTGDLSIARFIGTVDDVLKAAILAKSVSNSVDNIYL